MKKIEPNIPKNMNRLATFASANVRLRKKRIGSIGCSVRSSHATKHASSAPPRRNAPMIWRGSPAVVVGADQSPHDPDKAGAAQDQTGQIELGRRSARLLEAQEDERHEHQPDRHVEPEDPVPGDAADDRAADHRPQPTARPLIPPQIPSATPRRAAGTAATAP